MMELGSASLAMSLAMVALHGFSFQDHPPVSSNMALKMFHLPRGNQTSMFIHF